MNFEKRISTFLAAAAFALTTGLLSAASMPTPAVLVATLAPAVEPAVSAAPAAVLAVGDCSVVPAAACGPNSQTIVLTPNGLPQSCFGCPVGSQTSQWHSEPNPAPGNAPRLRLPKYKPDAGFCEQLIQVDIEATGIAQGLLKVEHRDTLNTCPNEQLTLNVDIQLSSLIGNPAFQPMNIPNSQSIQITPALGPYDGVTDFGGTSGAQRFIGPNAVTRCQRFTGTDVAFFVDTTATTTDDFMFFTHEANDSSSATPCTRVTFESDPFASLEVTVTYTICRMTPPDLVNDLRVSTCRDTPININVFANDTSDTPLVCPVIGTSTGITVTPPTAGTATWFSDAACVNALCPSTCIRFVPAAGSTVSATITYTLGDTEGCTDTATVPVNVRTPPVLTNDAGAGCQGFAIDVCVFANDTTDTQLNCPTPGTSTGITNIPAGWTATWVTLGSCAEGALTCTDLAMRITPVGGFSGVLSPGIRYTLTDTDTCSDFADVTITVRTPPVLNNDTGVGCAGSAIDVCVFANDSTDTQLSCPTPGSSTGITNIPAGWTATWVTLGSCAEGALTCTDLAIRITPIAGFTGVLSPGIRYTLSDTDVCSDFADVQVTVRTPPVLADDSGSGCVGTPIDVCVFANDTTDTQLTCPAPGSSTGITNIPAGWTATWVSLGSCAEGALTCTDLAMRITPVAGFTGVLAPGIRYTLTDTETCSDFADVQVTVRTPPVLVNDTGAGCVGTPIDVCVFANDTTDTALSCPAPGSSTGITNIPAGWTATWVTLGSCAEGALTCTDLAIRVTPVAGFTGVLSPGIRYTLSDTDTCSDFADVQITVRTPPVLVDDAGVGCQGNPIDVCVFANDTTDTQLTCPAPGTSTGVSNIPAGWTATWVALGSCAEGALTCTDLALRITPPAAFTGVLAPPIRYTLSDTDACSDFADVQITVRTPPVLANDTGAGCVGTPIDVCVFANDTTDTQLTCPAPGTSTGVSNLPAGWTATWVTLGSCTEGALTCTDLALRITPVAGFTGVLSPGIRYTLSDTDTCSDFADIVVTVRTPPVLVNDAGAGCVGSPIDVCVFANDTTDTQLNCPAPGTSTGITNIPAGWTATWVTLGSCAEGALTCTDLAMRITPIAGFTGVLSPGIRYTLSDTDTCSDFADVQVTVRTPPVLANDTGAGCQGSPIDVCVFANDTTDTQLTCPAPGTSTGISNLPAGWTATWVTLGSCTEGALTCTDLALRITPVAGFTGVLSPGIRYTLSDTDTCSDFADVQVTVRTPPVLVDDAGIGCQGSPIDVCVFANDTTDTQLNCPAPGTSTGITNIPAGWTATWVSLGSCAEGALTCNNLAIRITPAAAFTGVLSPGIRYTLSDTDTCSDFADVAVTVRTPPNLNPDSGAGCLGDPIDVCVFANDTSDTQLTCPAPGTSTGISNIPAGWTATWVTVGRCPEGALTCTNLAMRITPVAGFTGVLSPGIRYTLSDTDACSDFADVQVTVCRTQADDEQITLCIGESGDLDVLLGDSTTCGSLQCPPTLGAIPPQISVTPVNCGGPTCTNCVLRITALALPPGPAPFQVSFDYTVKSSVSPFCEANGRVTVNLTPNPKLCDLPSILKPLGSTTPIPIDVLACTNPGPDPGPGCTFDLTTLVLIPPFATQGSVSVNTLTGVITYTPFANFTGTDRVCYRMFNSCGCPDDACIDISDEQPCPTANRLECGSLLLFPEFNNTAGNLTLVTITDGCCGNTTQNSRIEVVYIKKTNCLETNRTYTLTPCDTLSFVTNFNGPANSQGYLYAFAKSAAVSPNNPAGTPIVYNHLIGQEVTMNGITQFEYAINAVSFKAFGAEGANNDDDGDGIRDLNGLPDRALSEYEQAPDRILIPRFLGQDPAGAGTNAYQSDIILVGLSGGSQFTTLLDVLVYNDNEEQFSDQHEFYCWEKIPLRDFSAWTLESSLKLTNHNPNEVRNFDNAHESGWISINGATASSSAETINDPAFYAVLVERAGSKHAADLPFEFCLQDNGDLLPKALFGDGPNPHAGDDQ